MCVTIQKVKERSEAISTSALARFWQDRQLRETREEGLPRAIPNAA
jgi:hypothetical protein